MWSFSVPGISDSVSDFVPPSCSSGGAKCQPWGSPGAHSAQACSHSHSGSSAFRTVNYTNCLEEAEVRSWASLDAWAGVGRSWGGGEVGTGSGMPPKPSSPAGGGPPPRVNSLLKLSLESAALSASPCSSPSNAEGWVLLSVLAGLRLCLALLASSLPPPPPLIALSSLSFPLLPPFNEPLLPVRCQACSSYLTLATP